MIIIEKVHIEKFRGFENTDILFNRPVNAIIGRNGTLKTTLLGILAQPFSLETGSMSAEQPLFGGKKFNSRMSDKFKFSDKYDVAGEHKWTLVINPQVYPKREYTCVSERRTDNSRIRFWSVEGREKGMNYIQCPVIYLSLKRLLPIGEEKNIKIAKTSLTDEEMEMYVRLHNGILICGDEIFGIASLKSTNKYTIGPETDHSDAITISAGQDNVGRIILAVFSMKRLLDKYQEEYKGGIILIDEIENTLYPAAQEKLIDFMYEAAYKYKLQFFFTTHSMSMITYLKTGKNHERSKLVYLQNVNSKIRAIEDPSLRDIENHLNVSAGRKKSETKIKVYCEDAEGLYVLRALLPRGIKNQVSFVTGINLPWTVYKTLWQKKIPEFMHNIIVLDGDVRNPETGWRGYPKNKNIVLLPTDMAPERMLYEMLFNYGQDDGFWDNSLSGYSRDVCFRDYPTHIDDIDKIKEWFHSQKDFAGKNYCKFINEWKRTHQPTVNQFINEFVCAYNRVAKLIGCQDLEINESAD